MANQLEYLAIHADDLGRDLAGFRQGTVEAAT